MKRLIYKAYLTALLSVFSTNVFSAVELITIGDSITAGFKSPPRSCPSGVAAVPTSYFPQGFPGVFDCDGLGARNVGGYQPRLRALFSEAVNTYNWGVSGDYTSGMLSRVNTVLNNSGNPGDYVLIMGGVNDVPVFNVSTTITNLRAIIQRVKQRGMIPILATITPSEYNGQTSTIETVHNPQVVALAREQGVALADQFTVINANWNVNQSGDGIHISGTGDQRLAEQWFAAYQRGPNTAIAPIINLLLD
jgi:lysophospholipase L1-like esterase